jgi:hypothetical protein
MPDPNTCVTLNTQGNEPNVISTLVTDIVLLLIMLIGLYRLQCHGGGTFRLGRLLWKQVKLYLAMVLVLSLFTYVFSVPKGVIWLLVAAIAEIPPVVSLRIFFYVSFTSPLLASGIYLFEYKW